MTLTTEDLTSIKHLFDDKFEHIDAQFENVHQQIAAVRGDIDNLALATAQQFAEVDRQFAEVDQQFTEVHEQLADIRDDVVVTKDMVKDHSFRITRLEH